MTVCINDNMSATLSTISDASTVLSAVPPKIQEVTPAAAAPDNRIIHPGVGKQRMASVMMEGAYAGPKNRFNRRLTEPNPEVHRVTSGNTGSLNFSSRKTGVPEMFQFSSPVPVVGSDAYGPDTFITSSGSMSRLINTYDSENPINAMPSKNFKSGGTASLVDQSQSLTAAGNDAQTSWSSLDDAKGLDFTYYASKAPTFTHYDKVAKQNFMKRLSERVLDIGK